MTARSVSHYRLIAFCFIFALLACVTVSSRLPAAEERIEDLRAEIDKLRADFASLHSGLEVLPPDGLGRDIDCPVSNALNESLEVKTWRGQLEIGGLLQVWAYAIQDDSQGSLDIPRVIPGQAGMSATDNREASADSFRIRRAELRFKMDIQPNIFAYVSVDAAREATGFPSFPSNQGTGLPGDDDANFFSTCNCIGQADPRALGTAVGVPNRLLQDAYINYHECSIDHDFTVGQFRRHLGEEGTRDDGNLDFAERSMITQIASQRDLGLQAHGSWLDDRIQYWAGVFDDAGTAFQQRANRADESNFKDVMGGVEFRPISDDCRFGTLEFGYSILHGRGGEHGTFDPTNGGALNGLNRKLTIHQLQYAYASYMPNGVARGWWLRGEWGEYRDRFAPGEVDTGNSVLTTNPDTFRAQGWYVSTGYELGRSVFADCLPAAAKNVEFAFRYDVMQNVFFHNLANPDTGIDLFKTEVMTAGVNYYIKGENAKLQLNYNWVREPDRSHNQDDRQFREVKNNNLILSLQVEF